LEPSFLDWISRTRSFVDICKAASEGTTNRVRLQEDRFLQMKIPLPLPPEQRRIVTRIEELAAKINEARRLRGQAAKEAATLASAAARQRIGSLDVKQTPLSAWLDPKKEGIQTGPFGAQLSRHEFTETGRPLLTIGNIQYGGLATSDLKFVSEAKADQLSRYEISMGDVLFARMGTVGRCCVVPRDASGWLINYHIIRVALDQSRVDPRFIHWTIQASPDVEEYLSDTIRGATRAGVNSRIVAGLPCRVPSLCEQRGVIADLDALQARVDTLKPLQAETAAELDALLPSILDRAFKGDL
jgi:type I restriction enzyme S subunit